MTSEKLKRTTEMVMSYADDVTNAYDTMDQAASDYGTECDALANLLADLGAQLSDLGDENWEGVPDETREAIEGLIAIELDSTADLSYCESEKDSMELACFDVEDMSWAKPLNEDRVNKAIHIAITYVEAAFTEVTAAYAEAGEGSFDSCDRDFVLDGIESALNTVTLVFDSGLKRPVTPKSETDEVEETVANPTVEELATSNNPEEDDAIDRIDEVIGSDE